MDKLLETRRILNQQGICYDKIKDLIKMLEKENTELIFTYCNLFNYGFIEGKRAERAKKRNKYTNYR